jgi:hypothetical protein
VGNASPDKIRTANKVLTKIRLYDPSYPIVNEGMIQAWAVQLTLVNMPEDIALEAVDLMYSRAAEGFRPLPGALVTACREIQRARFDKRQEQKILEAPPDNRISLAEWEREHGPFPRVGFAKNIPEEDEIKPLRVPCPYCKAMPGSPCIIPGSRQLLAKSKAHPSRMEAAEQCQSLSSERPAPMS